MRVRARPLDGAVVVVTGASNGIGRATALAFASHRTRLVLGARSSAALEELAARCAAAGAVEVVVAPLDVSVDDGAERVTSSAVEAFGRIDVWVHTAAVLVAGELPSTPVDDLRRIVDVNVTGTLLVARSALGRFETQGAGTLINVSSMLALVPNPLVPAYVATKAAVRGLTLALRQGVWGRPQVQVCVVVPGPVDTTMFQHAANRTRRELRAIPPACSPERLAAAVVGCARRPRRQVTAGVLPRLMLVAHRLAPRTSEWALGQYSKRLLLRPGSSSSSDGVLHRPHATGVVQGGWRRGARRRAAGDALGRWSSRRATRT
jgi:short-subunit dehydrogenase